MAVLKCLILLTLVGGFLAHPTTLARSAEDLEELKGFLEKTKKDRDITFEEAMTLNPQASPWENSGKYQGDIVLQDEEIEEMVEEYAGNTTTARNGLLDNRHRWPGGVVYYDIAPNIFSQHQLNMIQQAANFFHDWTCTRWVRRTNQRDYVLITGRSDGCYATVGFWSGYGMHTLNLAPNGCFNTYIIIHEMLHSVGFHHMHQTYNRYDWIWINWQNVAPGMGHNFDIFNNQMVTMLNVPYEYGSNQHYGSWAFSHNNQPTIVPRFNDHGQMGQLTHITGWDVLRLARLYNCPGAWSVPINPQDANKPYDEEFARKMRVAADEELRERARTLDQVLAEEKIKNTDVTH